MQLIAEDLITSVKIRSLAPISQNTFDDDKVLQVINEEQDTKIVPAIMAVREDFWLASKRVSLTANLNRYQIPERATGNALEDIWVLDSSGNRSHTLNRTTVHDLTTRTESAAAPTEMLLKGDEVIVFPTPSASQGSLEYWYYSRVNKVVKTENCTKITGISSAGGTTTFTVNTDLTGSLSVGDRIDFVSGKSPFLLWAEDVAITAITSTTIAVATTDVSNEVSSVEPVANDYICPARQTNYPMMPEEWHPILAHVAAIRLVKSLGHLEKAVVLTNELKEELIPNVLKLISNRVQSQAKPIINRHDVLSAMGL